MPDLDEPTEPPKGFARDHLRRDLASDGAKGHEWQKGVFTLLLTTVGRRTGQARQTPLIYGRDGDNYLVVASLGGSPVAPQWYTNLQANPRVRIQVGADVMDADARTATPEEKSRLWPVMTKIWKHYDSYQRKTTRDIPIVILTPVT
jgi:deazaflavin-dependent oxidoreductase (nitroreductase family)